uniref:Uncharacterized protein n=1 Tax=Gopherus evgoodei TaxID=1825980 RepID=A0A8C4YV96_9SAUR
HMQILSWGVPPCMCLVANIVFAFFLLFPGILSHVQLVQSVPGAVNPGQSLSRSCAPVGNGLEAQYTRNCSHYTDSVKGQSSRRAEHTARYHCVRD